MTELKTLKEYEDESYIFTEPKDTKKVIINAHSVFIKDDKITAEVDDNFSIDFENTKEIEFVIKNKHFTYKRK